MTHTCKPHTSIGEPIICWVCECGQNWEVHPGAGQPSAISRLKAASLTDVAERQLLEARIQLRKNPPGSLELHIVHDLTTPPLGKTGFDNHGLPKSIDELDYVSFWVKQDNGYLIGRWGGRVDTWWGKTENFGNLRLTSVLPKRGSGLSGQTFKYDLGRHVEGRDKVYEIQDRRVAHGYTQMRIP